MKFCWFGNYDSGYARNKILIDGLRANGVEVVECHVSGRGFAVYLKLIKKYWGLKKDFDYVYCAFPIHLSIFITLFSRRPVIADMLVSLYDTSVTDRQLYSRFHPLALILRGLDIITVKLANIVVVDTEAHKDYFSSWCNPKKIAVVPVGVHTGEFFPIPRSHAPQTPFLAQFHGSYIPLQGIDKIVASAALLKDDPSLVFRLIGDGQEYVRIKTLVENLQLTNVTFLPWLSIPELNRAINEADVLLGIFGDSEKTDRVVPNKIFQALAAKKPLITKDTETLRQHFTDNELLLVQNTPAAIVAAIKQLQHNSLLREQLATAGYQKVTNQYNERCVAAELLKACSL